MLMVYYSASRIFWRFEDVDIDKLKLCEIVPKNQELLVPILDTRQKILVHLCDSIGLVVRGYCA